MAKRPAKPDPSAAASGPFKPTREQLLAANDKAIADLIAPNLKVLFCGINPGLYSGATGHHFAKPGNRFWPALFAGGFTPRILKPWEERELLTFGCGIINVVNRTTATAAELSNDELIAGGAQRRKLVTKMKPKFLAVLGIGAYRAAFNEPKADLGLQPQTIGSTRIWVLPNPSGLNAHYTPASLGVLFKELREAVES
ncbi:MAG TPA: G/U mismatch-specific DNA glycosylase [Tepidisphaeraceae bacterium]|jgi:TDG/mug DNA glycosylase family protein